MVDRTSEHKRLLELRVLTGSDIYRHFIYNKINGIPQDDPYGIGDIVSRVRPSKEGKLGEYYFYAAIAKASEIGGRLHLVYDGNGYCHCIVVPPGYFFCESKEQLAAWGESVYEFHDHRMLSANYDTGMEEWDRQDEDFNQLVMRFEYCGDSFDIIFCTVLAFCIIPDIGGCHFIYDAEIQCYDGKFFYAEEGISIDEMKEYRTKGVLNNTNAVVSQHLLLPLKPFDGCEFTLDEKALKQK